MQHSLVLVRGECIAGEVGQGRTFTHALPEAFAQVYVPYLMGVIDATAGAGGLPEMEGAGGDFIIHRYSTFFSSSFASHRAKVQKIVG